MPDPNAEGGPDIVTMQGEIEKEAQLLIAKARTCGYNLEIVPRPRLPLAMGRYDLVVTVWPARK